MNLITICCVSMFIRMVLPLLFPSLPFQLSSTVEIANPVSSFKALKEAFYYFQHGIDLYDGGINHNPPLLVMVLNYIDAKFSGFMSNFMFSMLYMVIDFVIASRLVSINKWYNSHINRKYHIKAKAMEDNVIRCLYLFNPLVIFTNLSRSTLCFSLLAITESVYQLTINKNLKRASACIATSAYLSFTPIYLIIPLFGLAYALIDEWKFAFISGASSFVTFGGALLYASYYLTNSWKFMDQCYGNILRFQHITPNTGLWWYFFTEMFEFFSPFYLGVFNIYSVVFILPITLRLIEFRSSDTPRGDAFLAFISCYIWLSFTKAYSSFGDFGYALSIVPMFTYSIIPHSRFMVITGLTVLIALILSPIFYYCWIVSGNGNSNFFYSINLVWGGAHGILLTDLLWSHLVLDYTLSSTSKITPVKALRLTQI